MVGPDGAVVPDLKRKLPGRGVWVTATPATLSATRSTRKVFARGFKRDVRVAPDLVEQTERLLERAALDALAIAGKAGRVATGFAKVEAALDRDADRRPCCMPPMPPRTGSASSRPRCAGAAQIRHRQIAVIGPLRRRNWIWHWAGQMWYMQPCLPGPRATRFWRAAARLERFRTGDPGERDAQGRSRTDRVEERNG